MDLDAYLLSMDSYLSQGMTLTGRHDSNVPRLRLLRTPAITSTATTQQSPEEVQLPSSPSSSSSPTPSNRRRAPTDDAVTHGNGQGAKASAVSFAQQARSSVLSTSSSSDSPAARLRAITERVTSSPNLNLSTSTTPFARPQAISKTPAFPLPQDLSRGFLPNTGHDSADSPYQYFDTESEAGTIVRPPSRNAPQPYTNALGRERDRKVSLPSDLESDVEIMATHAAQAAVASSSRAHMYSHAQASHADGSIGDTSDTSGVDKLKAFWAKMNMREDIGGESRIAQEIKNKHKVPTSGLGLGNAPSTSKAAQRIRTSSLTKASASNEAGTHLRGATGRLSLSDEETERNVRTPARPRESFIEPSWVTLFSYTGISLLKMMPEDDRRRHL